MEGIGKDIVSKENIRFAKGMLPEVLDMANGRELKICEVGWNKLALLVKEFGEELTERNAREFEIVKEFYARDLSVTAFAKEHHFEFHRMSTLIYKYHARVTRYVRGKLETMESV